MAQKVKIDPGLFGSSEPGQPVEVPAEGKIISVSVGLKTSELELIDGLAARYDVARNALLRLAARRFLEDVAAGRLELEDMIEAPPPPKRRVKLP